MPPIPAVEVHGLTKTFGRVTALDGLDLTVADRPGGRLPRPQRRRASPPPSGSCSGCCAPTPGTVRLLGGDPWADAVALHRRLAYVPGDVALWPNLTGGEAIDLLGRLRGPVDPTRKAELLERFELDPTKKARTYSKGNRQKVALVAALAADVELLVLDEPTSGLDPLMEAVFTECIRRGQGGRPVGAAVQPHPGRGGEALRHRHDHPGRPHRGARHARRAAPPHPDHGDRGDRAATRPGWPTCPASTT